MNSTSVRARWLASSEVISQVVFTSKRPKKKRQEGFFRYIVVTQWSGLAPIVWLHSSVGRASHRYSRRSRVRIPLKPWFFQASSFQLLKLENLLRWLFFTLIYQNNYSPQCRWKWWILTSTLVLIIHQKVRRSCFQSFDSFKANEIEFNVTILELARLCVSFAKENSYFMENFGGNC